METKQDFNMDDTTENEQESENETSDEEMSAQIAKALDEWLTEMGY